MAPKKKKKSTAAGGGAAAVKAKKKGSKKKAGPSTLRVLLGTNESIIKIEVSDELTVGELRARAMAAAAAADDGGGAWEEGCVLRRHDDDALKRGARTPSQLEALDDAALVGDLDVEDADPPSLRLDARCAHVLAKHVECAGNVSRRTGDESALTKGGARGELEALRATIAAADDPVAAFFAAAATRSDCASYASQGDLGNRGRGRMSKDFEAAIFALPINGLSGVVDTEVGLHLIMRLPLEEAAPAR
ncbi:hypothetical protein JL720_2199 [Aureococcus anophagefferens]|nr:hypothetical protein JL720_2199 [Aureococcus anophagefferens]